MTWSGSRPRRRVASIADEFSALDSVIHQQIERSKLLGLAIALVRDDKVVWSRGYGFADLETKQPVTPQTVFSIQSVTKPVVATALMQWRERGRFALDDSVALHLAPVALQNQWEETSPVTFRRLLTHTAGLPVDIGGGPHRTRSPATLDEFVARVAKTVQRPGEEIVYANYGYDIIGLLIERLSGQPFHAALRDQVLEPLEMQSTYVGRQPERVTPARGYYLSAIDGGHHAVPHDYEEVGAFPRPAGVLMSNVEDLARFLIAHLDDGEYRGRRLIAAETAAEMQTLQARHGGAGNGMGLGFKVDEGTGGRRIYHGGDGVGFTAFVGACPEKRAGVVLLMNTGRAHTARSVIGEAALRGLLGEPLEERPAARVPEVASLTGRYVSNFWGYVADLTECDAVPALEVVGGGLLATGEESSVLSSAGNGRYVASGGFFDGFQLVAGGWSGSATSPIGPVPLALAIDGAGAKVSVLSAHANGGVRGNAYARGAFGEVAMPVELERA